MYALSLIVVFVLAVMVEFLSNLNLVRPGSNRVAAVAFQSGIHAIRAGFAYMVMLAVMSYNGGVFITAAVGHAVGIFPMIMTPSGSMYSGGGMNTMDAMHESFFWGKNVTILFKGWPDNNLGMYVLALVFVFFLAFSIEILSVTAAVNRATTPAVGALAQTGVYALRIALAYLVMLSIMSFNLGVFIVVVAGHAFGYFAVKFRALLRQSTADTIPKV
nr:copper transporter 1-like [Ipomoea batatas]GMC90071.1 copper transporter 1-like [Ipomoea batatas]